MSDPNPTCTHPVTGHLAREVPRDEWNKPSAISIEVSPSKYPGEERWIMVEMSGVVMQPDGTAKMWTQVWDGLSIPHALRSAADMLTSLWDECTHEDPSVPHCYCKVNPILDGVEVDGLGCCTCGAAVPREWLEQKIDDSTKKASE